MNYFLDTCIILCGCTKYEDYYKKTHLLLKGNWLTSSLVVEELESIKRRRQEIYKGLIQYNGNVNITAEDFYKKYLKSACGDNVNDEKHLYALYENCLNQLRFSLGTILTKDKLDRLLATVNGNIRSIKVEVGALLSRLENNLTYYQSHVADHKAISQYKPMWKELKKLRNHQKHKEDLKIIMDAIGYSYDNHSTALSLVSCDSFFIDNKDTISSAIKMVYAAKPIKPSVVIQHIRDI